MSEIKEYSFIIPGQLPNLNAELNAAKAITYMYRNGKRQPIAGMGYKSYKALITKKMAWLAHKQLKGVKISGNCAVVYRWYCPNRRKDPQDNITFGIKYVWDGLVMAGVLPNDGWKNLSGGALHLFSVDKESPRLEMTILENYTFHEKDIY